MFYQPRNEELWDDCVLKNIKAWPCEHFKTLQKNKLFHNDDPNDASFSSFPYTLGTYHNGFEVNRPKVYDDRSRDDYLADFKKWSKNYYIFLRMKNQVLEGTANDILINDSVGTKRFQMPLENGIFGQPEVQVRQEMFGQPPYASPRNEELWDDRVSKKFKAWPREHFKTLQKNKLFHNDDPKDASFSSFPYTLGTYHNGFEVNQPKVYDDRSRDDYLADFKKWSKDYYISLRMKNQVPEGTANDILINDSDGTKRFQMPLGNGIVGQREMQVRQEMFRQPPCASIYFPNISCSSSCNLFNDFEEQQPRNCRIINPQHFKELSPRMNYTVPMYWSGQPFPLNVSPKFCFL